MIEIEGENQENQAYLYRTNICKDWQKYGSCNRSDKCLYAHGK